jgi:hypothetical protein
MFTQIIHKYQFKNFIKKAKAAVYFNQYEYVYVLLKLLSYVLYLWAYYE